MLARMARVGEEEESRVVLEGDSPLHPAVCDLGSQICSQRRPWTWSSLVLACQLVWPTQCLNV